MSRNPVPVVRKFELLAVMLKPAPLNPRQPVNRRERRTVEKQLRRLQREKASAP